MPQQNEPPESSATGKQTPARPKRKRRFGRRFWITAALSPIWLPLLFYGCIRATHWNTGPGNIRISPETTHVTEPLDEDGFVDYLAAVNLHAGEAVTAENNAAVLLLQAFGPPDMPSDLQDEYYRQIDSRPASAESYYFILPDRFAEQFPDQIADPAPVRETSSNSTQRLLDKRAEEEEFARLESDLNSTIVQRDWDSFHELCRRLPFDWNDEKEDVFRRRLWLASFYPWRKEHYPAVALWLERNEKPLALIFEASERPRFFSPLVTNTSSTRLLMAELVLLEEIAEGGQALVARALLHLGNGNPDAAWNDILAAHRLARLAGQHPTLIGGMVALRIERIARAGDIALANHPGLTADQFARMRSDLNALPPAADIVQIYDFGERMQLLDNVISIARGYEQSALSQHWNDSIVNWNNVLHDANEHIDELVAIARMPPGDQRDALSDEFERRSEKLRAEAESPATIVTAAFVGSQREKMLTVMAYELLLPSINAALGGQFKDTEQADLTRLALAVAHYRVERGEYPESLESLVPEYISRRFRVIPGAANAISTAKQTLDSSYMAWDSMAKTMEAHPSSSTGARTTKILTTYSTFLRGSTFATSSTFTSGRNLP